MPDTHAPSSKRSLASRFAGAGWLEAVRPTHAGAAVLLTVLAIGLVVEPGGPPAMSGAIEPAPLPEIPGGRAARVQAAGGADRVPAAATLPSRASAATTAGAADPPSLEAAASPPSLRVTPEELVLGTLEVGRAATGVFTITNRGRSTVSILGVRTTCGCTAAEPGRDRLEPGESTTLEVRFEGKNAGDQTQFVRLVTDDPAGPIIAVRVSARVTDAGAARGDG